MTPRVGRNDRCPCGSGKKFKRCCLDRERESVPAPAVVGEPDRLFNEEHGHAGAGKPASNAGDLTFFIETPNGMMVRRIPNASPLRGDIRGGQAAERATHDAAALWGLPDFVYRAEIRRVGSGSRELGDVILLIGDLGIVVQVKCRQAATFDEDKERGWVEKQTAKALAQANGTIRSLKQAPARLTNARGRDIEVDGNAFRWIAAGVIDHPHAPSGVIPQGLGGPNPAVVLLRRDYEFLFDQLKSTHAVGAYLERVAGEAVELGHEPVRYFELAAADQQASPDPLDPALLGKTGRQISSPMLPMEPAAADDAQAHRLVRWIFEDIATSDLAQTPEADRLRVLAELDRLPVSERSQIGRFLLDGLSEAPKVATGETEWRLRRIVGDRQSGHLAYGTCSEFSDAHKGAFSVWVQLRHHQLQQVNGVHDLVTVGVVLTPRKDSLRPWDTTMVAVSGDLGLTAQEVFSYSELWPGDE